MSPRRLSARGASDGRTIEISDADAHLGTLTFAVPGDPVLGWAPEGDDLLYVESGEVRSRLRLTADADGYSVTLTVDNGSSEAVTLPYLGVGVSLAPGASGWSWTADLDGLVAVTGPRGGFLLRLRSGFLRRLDELPVFPPESSDALAAFHLCPPEGSLGGHRRHTISLEISPLTSMDAASSALPAWLPQTVVSTGDEIEFALPDQAIVPDETVAVTLVDTQVVFAAPPGHHPVAVHGRGVHRLRLTWAPEPSELLPDLVEVLLRKRPGRCGDAIGYLVADALSRGLVVRPERALDWLEQVDWLDRGSLLGDLAAGLLALQASEPLALASVWRGLGMRPVEPGYGLGVLRLGVAALGRSDAPSPVDALLSRSATGPEASLELALLRRSRGIELDALVTLVSRLGGSLPGSPIGLDAASAARIVGLFGFAPEEWAGKSDAAASAAKVRRLLLADASDALARGGVEERAFRGLAWLMVGELGD